MTVDHVALGHALTTLLLIFACAAVGCVLAMIIIRVASGYRR